MQARVRLCTPRLLMVGALQCPSQSVSLRLPGRPNDQERHTPPERAPQATAQGPSTNARPQGHKRPQGGPPTSAPWVHACPPRSKESYSEVRLGSRLSPKREPRGVGVLQSPHTKWKTQAPFRRHPTITALVLLSGSLSSQVQHRRTAPAETNSITECELLILPKRSHRNADIISEQRLPDHQGFLARSFMLALILAYPYFLIGWPFALAASLSAQIFL